MHPLVTRILENRNISDTETFLNPLYDARHDPFLLKGMDTAVSRILAAIEKKEKIAIWHDYDCDGIPAGALLYDFFQQIGYPVLTYVPERSEGYGLNEPGIRALKEKGVALVVTVDCGITDVEEVKLARELGMDVIITDHHLPQAVLPPALSVINAHQKDDTYPFKELCGTGVAFKLVEALVQKNLNLHIWRFREGQEKWLLDLVAIATVADMVPLTDENRMLVRYGLMVIHKNRRPGLRALLEAEKIPAHSVTEDDIAFSIAPKINAASRMKSPKLAFELLTTDSYERAKELAKELVKLNKNRKVEGMRVAKDVKKKIETLTTLDSVIVMGSNSWRPSLLGIAATGIVQTYQKPVCLWGKDGELIKGSCRSDGTVNIVELLVEAKDAFLDFGGHELSGGFSVAPESIHELPAKLVTALETLRERNAGAETAPAETLIESSLTLAEINDHAYEALRTLAPFGQQNPKPIFRLKNVTAYNILFFGAHKEHARITLTDDSGARADAIAFFFPRTNFRDTLALLSAGDTCTVDACIERSYFAGRRELRLRIENLVL